MKDAPIPTGLLAQFRRHAKSYLLGTALLAVYQTLTYAFDRGLWYGVDMAIGGHQKRALTVGILLAIVPVVAMGVRVLSRVLIFNGGRDIEYELRHALLDRLHLLGPAFYRKMPSGEIMSRATNDLTQVRLLLGFSVLNSVNTVFALASALTIALSISVKLTLASLATLPVLMLVTRRFSKSMFSLTRSNQAVLGQMSDRVQASLAGMRVVKSFALEDVEVASFQKVNEAYLDRSLALARLRGSMMPVTQSLSAVGLVIVFWYGGHLVLVDEITPGGFVAMFWAMQRLAWPLMALGFVVGMIARGRAAYTRLEEIFQAQPDVVDGSRRPEAPVRGELEVRNLCFSYRDDAPLVLDGVSFRIPARGSLALVGRTGSGKSTLASLLPRLLPAPRGTIFLDGIDVCDLPLEVVRQAIGYAQQDSFLFSTTVARNIGFSLDDTDTPEAQQRIRSRAKDAQVLEETLRLPDGFHTVVGERGVQLSGGQKQRIALARALMWQPKVLVLDDPISAVDARTEAAILDTIQREAERRTILLITHRVAAAQRCDQIVVLDGGHVVAHGTHNELLRQGGLYARFAEEQRLEGEIVTLGEREAAAASAGAA
ncbi:MAG TPA: ABC transporter ATP-binding protein [Polyangiaceae bacterium]